MRVCLIASSRFAIREPFAGGLESLTHGLARELGRRGHEVTLFAAPGSDPTLPVTELAVQPFVASEQSLRDPNAPHQEWLSDHHAYLALMLDLAEHGAERYDVVHNNSLHHLPVAMAPALRVPVLTTLHTPPLPWLESAVALSGRGRRQPGSGLTYAAVSRHTARAWSDVVAASVVPNGVDVASFVPGPGGGPAVWSGRMVAEKAPHDAIAACRAAGVELVLAGPASDPEYVDVHVRPLLGDGVTWAGHLDRHDLVQLLGEASVALVTPAWDEPYGLVAAEALACGTPVAGYARGALPEIVTPEVGTLAPPGDVGALAQAVVRSRSLSRQAARAHAVETCSLSAMLDAYEGLYGALVPGHEAA